MECNSRGSNNSNNNCAAEVKVFGPCTERKEPNGRSKKPSHLSSTATSAAAATRATRAALSPSIRKRVANIHLADRNLPLHTQRTKIGSDKQLTLRSPELGSRIGSATCITVRGTLCHSRLSVNIFPSLSLSLATQILTFCEWFN